MTVAEQPKSQLSARATKLLFSIWAFWSVLLLMFALRAGDGLMTDPDDFMRLAQVRDWMAGQSWFDVTQYRINPPVGGAMHWSRLLDVPIAAGFAFFGLFLPTDVAEHVTILVVPLLLLGLTMSLAYRTARQFADEKIALLAALLLPTFPLIIRQNLPGRVDHHGWQITMAALAMWGLFHPKPMRGAWLMAFAVSFWMHISIEGLPYVLIFGSILAAFYVFPALRANGQADDRLIHFVNGLTLFSIIFWVATQASVNLAMPYCDAVSWPLLAALALVATGLNAVHYVLKPKTLPIRMGALAVVAIIGAATFLGFSESCALDPFGQISPLVREYWHETISEGLPIHKQAAALISLLLFVPIVFAIWIRIALRQTADPARRHQWLTLAALVALTTLLSFKVQRTAGVAELFALPAIAALLGFVLARIGQSSHVLVRVFGAVAAIFAMSPMIAFVGGDALFGARAEPRKAAVPQSKKRSCNIAELNRLPRGLIYTTMAAGPEILYRTKHSVFVSGYHRNAKTMDRMIATMLGNPANARAEITAINPDYVVFCPTHFEAQSYLKAAKSGFAASLMKRDHPDWLVPMAAFANSEMRVFRVSKVDGQ